MHTLEQKILFFLFGTLVCGFVLLFFKNFQADGEFKSIDAVMVGNSSQSFSSLPTEEKTIIVHVAGAVKRPGVYEVEEGKRVIDVVNESGAEPFANLDGINLARLLSDGEKLVVPYMEFKEKVKDKVYRNSRLLNINTATKEELEKLPGVGPMIAGYVVFYRNQNGLFHSKDEIKNVERIGDKVYSRIRDLITI